jgi:ketosteroid isomerase-like protein
MLESAVIVPRRRQEGNRKVMRPDSVALMHEFAEAYAVRDLDRALACFSDDVIYALHVDRDVVPFAGVTIGKAQFRNRLEMIASLFDMPLYRLEHAALNGDELHASIAYRFRHIVSGEEIEGNMRAVIWVRGGLFARVNEYHDRARVEAFFRLIASGATQ